MKKIILLLAVLALSTSYSLRQASAEISVADKEFLLQQCQIFQDDVDVIAKLSEKTQQVILAAIAARDSAGFSSFKNTRNYYKFLLQIGADSAMPFPHPPEGWNGDYLTADELKHYDEILKSYPPYVEKSPAQANLELTSAEKDTLKQECQIPQEDIDVISQFMPEVRANISRWLTVKDYRKLVPLKQTRDYYRKLISQPGQKLPTPPATWDIDYLTEEEFLNYCNILNHAPW